MVLVSVVAGASALAQFDESHLVVNWAVDLKFNPNAAH